MQLRTLHLGGGRQKEGAQGGRVGDERRRRVTGAASPCSCRCLPTLQPPPPPIYLPSSNHPSYLVRWCHMEELVILSSISNQTTSPP